MSASTAAGLVIYTAAAFWAFIAMRAAREAKREADRARIEKEATNRLYAIASEHVEHVLARCNESQDRTVAHIREAFGLALPAPRRDRQPS